jgi:fructose-bisphosphate aldolase class II
MSLAAGADVLGRARRDGRGVGAFNVILLEHAEAIVAGAERAGLPVVLQISQNTVAYHGALAPIAGAALAVAEAASVPVVVHLDHAEDEALVEEAVRLGLTSVMYDGSRLPFDANVARTADVARRCRAAGVSVEAELGEVGGKDGAHAPGVRTDPDQAAAYVAATGVDALAVAVGTSHAMADRSAVVDVALVQRLAAAVPVPLVLHGSSGVDDPGLAATVAAGVTKVNIATRLNQVMVAVVRDRLAADPAMSDPRRYLGPARDAVAAEVAGLLALLAHPPR